MSNIEGVKISGSAQPLKEIVWLRRTKTACNIKVARVLAGALLSMGAVEPRASKTVGIHSLVSINDAYSKMGSAFEQAQ